MGQISWLHLSDLHISDGNVVGQMNQQKVIGSLLEDLQEQRSLGFSPNIIVFSGDIANRGQLAEYTKATELLFEPLMELFALTGQELILVPGNHDVNRKRIHPFFVSSYYQLLDDRDATNELFLTDDRNLRDIFSKFEEYESFAREITKSSMSFDHSISKRLTINGRCIGFAGINSAWMSAVVPDTHNPPEVLDMGNLLIGEVQIDRLLNRLDNCDIRIAVMHHPLNYLRERERVQLEKRFENSFDVVLHGHLHTPYIRVVASPAGSSVTIPCGCLYSGRSFRNGYNMVSINLSTGEGQAQFRTYVDDGYRGTPSWTRDLTVTPDRKDGEYSFVIERLINSTPGSNQISDIGDVITSFHTIRVLSLENDEYLQQQYKKLMPNPPFEVDAVYTIPDAYGKIRSKKYDLVIVDLSLEKPEDLQGVLLLSFMKQTFSYTPTIVVTGSEIETNRLIFEQFPFVKEVLIKGINTASKLVTLVHQFAKPQKS